MLIFKLVLGVTFFFAIRSFAFLDFIGEQAKKATEVSAYVDAATELSSEIVSDKDLENGAKDIQKRSDALRREAANVRSISQSTQSILKGPDWSSKRVETNIRSTTDFIRRVKRLIGRAAVLGTNGAIALNTTETNVALNEVQKNQQAMIMQNSDAQLRDLEREQEESKQWASFSAKQRKLRNSQVNRGQH